MDIRTGKTYRSREEAQADGVPDSDLALIEERTDGPQPRFMRPPQIEFTKGSFKPVRVRA